jgi:hypothetical protein
MGQRFYYAGGVRTTKVALFVAFFSLAGSRALAADDLPPPPPPPEVAPQAPKAGLQVPRFSTGGLVFAIEFGPGVWDFDRAYLRDQIATNPGYGPSADAIAGSWIGSLKTSYALTLRLGYNILGVASVEFAFSGTGFDVPTASPGGGGFAAGLIRFHPLEILWRALQKNDPRPFGLDFSMFWGWGYGIAGYDDNAISPAMGADGFAFQWGFDVEYFFNNVIGLSLGLRGAFPFWDHLYLDFDQRIGPALPGTTKGAFWMPTFGVVMRFGE